MAHRRSGAQRRAGRNALKRTHDPEARKAESDSAVARCEAREAAAPPAQRSSAPVRRKQKRCRLTTADEVSAAVDSLYADGLKPLGRLIRKRVAERRAHARATLNAAVGNGFAVDETGLSDVDMQHLRSVCDENVEFVVEPEEDGDWSVTYVGCQTRFVDVHSTVDIYPEELWADAAAYFETSGDELTLLGGRYSFAQELLSRRLPFLAGYNLGQVCHIVQLAMTQRKLLGYLGGAVVPYSRSQSRVKELCAGQQLARANPCQEALDLPCATWEQARECIRDILDEAAAGSGRKGPGAVPLSSVKRSFRSRFHIELSETMLGHSKLSELFQDANFADVCTVQLDAQGYTVVQCPQPPPASEAAPMKYSPVPSLDVPAALSSSDEDEREPRGHGFCSDEPLCLDDAENFAADAMIFGPTPGPFGPSPAPLPPHPEGESGEYSSDPGYLQQLLPIYLEEASRRATAEKHEACVGSFCLDEPLSLDDAVDSSEESLGFGPTPGPFGPTPGPLNLPLALLAYLPPVGSFSSPLSQPADVAADAVKVQDNVGVIMMPEQPTRTVPSAPHWPSIPPWKDGQMCDLVQNTFIHVAVPPSTPLPGTLRRTVSLGDLSNSTTPTSSATVGALASIASSSASSPRELEAHAFMKDRCPNQQPIVSNGVRVTFCLDGL